MATAPVGKDGCISGMATLPLNEEALFAARPWATYPPRTEGVVGGRLLMRLATRFSRRKRGFSPESAPRAEQRDEHRAGDEPHHRLEQQGKRRAPGARCG